MYLRECFCIACLHPTGARLGLDKKQRPYIFCSMCGSQLFVPRPDLGLRGLAILPALAEAWRETTAEDEQRTHLAAMLVELRNRATTAATAPPATGAHTLEAAARRVLAEKKTA